MKFFADVRRDIALGIRLLGRYPGFSAISIATLALAIGGNTAVFTIINTLLLTPPPVAEPAGLVRVHTGQSLASWTTYQDLRDRGTVFSSLAAARLGSMPLHASAQTTRLMGQITSPNFLATLGVAAEVGRIYIDGESPETIVLAHHIWRQHFAADPGVVGRTIVIGGRSLQVVGVMPRGFRALAPPGVRLDFWMPLAPRRDAASLQNRLLTQFEITGRLKPGVERAAATAELRLLASQLRAEHPELPEALLGIEALGVDGIYAFQGMARLVFPVFAFLALLAVVSGFVLVIGCSNIAGLLVGRGAMRQRDLAVRMSLGSSRRRLLQQLLTECLVLAFAGGAAGLLVAIGLTELVRRAVATLPFPLAFTFELDYRVLLYAVGLATATAVMFGLLPARGALRLDLVSTLKIEGSGSPGRQRLRTLMVAAQVAVCAALVVWSVLFLRSLGRIHLVDPGFDANGVVTSTVELDRGAIDAVQGDRILTEWVHRVQMSAAVESAAIANVVPLALAGREAFDVSLPHDPEGTRRRVVASRVTPGWFATVKIPLAAGRDFAWTDRRGAPAVAIVNETLARQFRGGDAVGRQVLYGTMRLEIVGVARDSKYWTLGEVTQPQVYLPLQQHYTHYVTLHARTRDGRGTADAIARELASLMPGTQVTTEAMSDLVAVAVRPAQIGAAATGIFGVLAVALAAFGVYGLVSFTVIQRTREIGIRRAVGATTGDVVRLIVRQHARLVAVGVAAGLLAGTLGATLLRSFLTGVGPADPLSSVTAVAIVAGAALLATMVPALRATRVDPIAALRDF